LRIVKYRGSLHGTNEYPFLIDESGISVLPITSVGLDHGASNERIPTGVPRLDVMLGGEGYYRGSTILVSGTAGSGKTSLAAHFAQAACARGERCLYLAFEESRDQMVRNMRSIGLDLDHWMHKGLLHFHASRPTLHGVELHLLTIHKLVKQIEPTIVIIDPISNFIAAGTHADTQAMLLRLIDFLKSRQVTALFTNLTSAAGPSQEATDIGVSSLIDTWLLMRDIELGGERNRGLYILKSRGMAHSNQIREFAITSHGVQLLEVYVGPEGVLTGSMRAAQEAREKAAAVEDLQQRERRQRELARKRNAIEAQIEALRAEFEATEDEARVLAAEGAAREQARAQEQLAMRQRRDGELAGREKSTRGITAKGSRL
jgi:circadian clock protein KaiC